VAALFRVISPFVSLVDADQEHFPIKNIYRKYLVHF